MTNNLDLKGSWGWYPWFDGSDEGFLIHPDDLEKAKKLVLHGKVFYCCEACGEFIQLQYGDYFVRVSASLFRTIRDVQFIIGDNVKVVSSAGKITIGIVLDIGWHHKKNEPMYYLSFNGKKSSRRYFESEMSAI